MATDRWIAANIGGNDYLFRTDADLRESVPPVLFVRKLTLLVHGVDDKGNRGVAPRKIGDRWVNGAHLVIWTECTAHDRAVMASVWLDEVAVVERPPLSLVGKENGNG